MMFVVCLVYLPINQTWDGHNFAKYLQDICIHHMRILFAHLTFKVYMFVCLVYVCGCDKFMYVHMGVCVCLITVDPCYPVDILRVQYTRATCLCCMFFLML